ncbi:MAG TPA: DNA N-6-adenine-methyltransferase [Polyangia bacterium]|nr:DNA N-6-adenine-methyltransferase [Polyangia bacterium]
MSAPSVHFSSARHDWATPPDLFARLDREFGFTLDVCALPENTKCARFFTPDDDGLAQDWGAETCWMNPPYGSDIVRWMRKAFAASLAGATVVCLVPSRTDTGWWHDFAMRAHERRFLRGRVRFVGATSGAPFPSAVVVFRSDRRAAR